MQVPLEIQAEWSSLCATHEHQTNQRSIQLIRVWLDGAPAYLETHPDAPLAKRADIYCKKNDAGVAGVTDPAFDGKSTPTLENWLTWWEDPVRSAFGTEEAGRDPAVQAARIRRELEARRG